MSESDTTEVPTAFVRFAAKTSPSQYNSREASVSIPVQGADIGSKEFLDQLHGSLTVMQIEVFEALGIEFEYDQTTNSVKETAAPVQVQPAATASNTWPNPPQSAPAGDAPTCPKCGSSMYDNRVGKRNPNAPDFKCRQYKATGCDGAIWPPREGR